MASQNSRLDDNHIPSQTGVSGTLGTSAVGTEDLVQFTADPTSGAQYVYNLAPIGSLTVGSITTSEVPATNTYGTSGSIADNALGTLVDYMTGTSFKLRGFTATGEGQGYFSLQIGVGSTKYSYYTSIADKTARMFLPNPEAIASSTRVILTVTNQNGDTRNFEGVVIGE